MALFSNEKEHASWRTDPTTRGKLEAAAFELLVQLCVGSVKGQLAVANAHECNACFSRAMEILSGIISVAPPPPSFDFIEKEMAGSKDEATQPNDTEKADEADEKGSDLDGSRKEGDDTNKNDGSGAVEDHTSETAEVTLSEIEDTSLVISAYSFLASIAPVSRVRSELLTNKSFILVTSILVKETKFPELQFEAIKVVSKLAPFASATDVLSSGRICDLLHTALTLEVAIKAGSPPRFSKNTLYINALSGIQFVFDSVPESKQIAVFNDASARYAKLLKNHAIARAVSNENEHFKGGELAYHLTTLMLLGKGKTCLDECFTQQLMTSLVNTIQWRFDPKTFIAESELSFWDASATQCLQILSLMLWRHDESLVKSGIKSNSLKSAVFMVARPGKAPRKSIDFTAALGIIVQHGEPAAKMAAMRIIDCMSL
jgi:hypothetical protein